MEIVRSDDGELEINGVLDEVDTVGGFLAVLEKLGAEIKGPQYEGDSSMHATMDLEGGSIGICIKVEPIDLPQIKEN